MVVIEALIDSVAPGLKIYAREQAGDYVFRDRGSLVWWATSYLNTFKRSRERLVVPYASFLLRNGLPISGIFTKQEMDEIRKDKLKVWERELIALPEVCVYFWKAGCLPAEII